MKTAKISKSGAGIARADAGQGEFARRLVAEVRALFRRDPDIPPIIGMADSSFEGPADLLASVLAAASAAPDADVVRRHSHAVFSSDAGALAAALDDIEVTARRNFEPGGIPATLLFSRGIHALLAHRVTHSLWNEDRRDLALALKTLFGRAFSTDIHPAARFGSGIWLDHGLGFVVGETAVIGDGVSIWHGVTLGSTLKDNSAQRHPRVGQGTTIGADAILLGGIDIGNGSVIAAGSIVLGNVEPGTTVAGVPATPRVRNERSFAGF